MDSPYLRMEEETARSRCCTPASAVIFLVSTFTIFAAAGSFAHTTANDSRLITELGEQHRVFGLPGAPKLDQKMYAGFVLSNRSAGNHLFYFIVESLRCTGPSAEAPHEVPLVVWLNGGPGASSLTGLMVEGVGPLLLSSDGEKMSRSPAAWSDVAHVVSWDSPVGSGYSFSDRGDDGYATSLEQVAVELREAMLALYELHPQYAESPLYLTGESFAGKYIPYLATHILHANAGGARRIPLEGIAIGNGWFRPLLQYTSLLDLAPAFGYADAARVRAMRPRIERCAHELRAASPDWRRAYLECQSVEDDIYSGALPFVYDVRATSPLLGSIIAAMGRYLNRDDVRDALHVERREWRQLDGGDPANRVSNRLWREQIVDLPAGMLEALLAALPGKVLLYTGNMDGSSCNTLGVARCIDTLGSGRVAPRATKHSAMIDIFDGCLLAPLTGYFQPRFGRMARVISAR